MHDQTMAQLAQALQRGDFSSVELTRHYLDRIQRLDSTYNSFITVTETQALQQAAEADRRLAQGDAPALCGIPLAHKDLFCTDGVRTSCGSKMLDNFVPPYSATLVNNLQTAGAVMLGKTNMDEFAMGSSNETSYYGPVKNPWAVDCVPGGSIRQPAALCGLTGLKPTYGRVSRWGMIAFASSLDQAGTLTRTAEDSALLLNTMASFDPKDSTSVDQPVEDYTAQLSQPLRGLKIGLPKEYFGPGLHPETAAAVDAAVKVYTDLGASVQEISLPHSHLAVPVYYVIGPAECSANLSRFDGVRYGYRCDDPAD